MAASIKAVNVTWRRIAAMDARTFNCGSMSSVIRPERELAGLPMWSSLSPRPGYPYFRNLGYLRSYVYPGTMGREEHPHEIGGSQ